jgi:hypothetical protein
MAMTSFMTEILGLTPVDNEKPPHSFCGAIVLHTISADRL